jgi:hypothetical protein
MVLLVETASESASLIAPLREAIRTIDGGVPAVDGQTIEAFYQARATTTGNVLRTLIGSMASWASR